MAKIYSAKDANLDLIRERPISVIGYGNQGRAQALNLRDSGMDVTIGNIDDDYAARAGEDGLTVRPIGKAAQAGEIVMMLLPDEIAPAIYERDILGGLAEGDEVVSGPFRVLRGLKEGTKIEKQTDEG